MNQTSEARNRIPNEGMQVPNSIDSVQSGYSEDVNFLQYWAILKSSKLLILIVTAIAASLGLGNAFISKPVYDATVTMVPVRQRDSELGFRGLAAQLTGGLSEALSLGSPGSVKAEALATLESYGFVTGFIEDEKLISVLFDPEDFEKDDLLDIPTLQDAYRKFIRKVFSVDEDRQTEVIKLTIVWKDPGVAAEWANALIARINRKIRQNVIGDAQKSIEFLNQELAKTSILELRQSIYRLIEVQINSIMLAETRSDYAFKVIDPAVPADLDRYVRPKRLQIVLISTLLGFAIACFFAFFRDSIRRLKEAEGGQ